MLGAYANVQEMTTGKLVVEADSTLQETSARLSHALDEQVGRFLEQVSGASLSEWLQFCCCVFVAM